VTRMPIGKFIVYSAAGALLWTIALVYAGTLLGAHWTDIRKALQPFDMLIAVLVVVGAVALLWMRLGRPGWPKRSSPGDAAG
jgi:membrane protein DedA with SNARE-associated domain